jgi:two-component system, OmpR family, sensor histidine kinase KdpD
MENNTENFVDPKELLTLINKKEKAETEGKLKIFLGMVAGVGKTYAMLTEAHQLRKEGIDVVIGLVEPHQRVDVAALMEGLPSIPLKKTEYRGISVSELDIDAVLSRSPKVILIDELAHTNVPDSRHTKRYLDIIEILKHGIDVHTCLNIQHLESLNDTIKEITGLFIKETVPDSFLERANEIVIIDLPPDALLKRLKEGKIYPGESIVPALNNFFREGNLAALREIALRFLAEKVENELRDYKILNRIPRVWKTGNRLMVGVFASPYSETLIRATKRIAGALGASWIGAYVDTGRTLSEEEKKLLENNLTSVTALGGEVIATKDDDIINGLLRVARQNQITQVVVGKTKKTWKNFLYRNTLLDKLFKQSSEIDILVVATESDAKNKKAKLPARDIGINLLHIYWGIGVIGSTTFLSVFLSNFMGYHAIGFVYLLAITFSAMYLRLEVVLGMALFSGLLWNFLFIPPLYTFVIAAPEDWMMVIMNFIAAAVIGILTRRLKTKQRILESRETTTTELYNFTKTISTSRDIDSMVKAAINHITPVFRAKMGILLKSLTNTDELVLHRESSTFLNQKDLGIAKWVLQNERPAGKFTDTLPSSNFYFTPLKAASETIGVLAVELKDYKTFMYEEKLFLDSFSGQLASGIARERMENALHQAKFFEESNRIYNTLMDSVSHELKTPLAVIHGSATALKEEKILNNKEAVSNLADEIIKGSQRMQHLVENLLDINRIETNKLQLTKEPILISEILMMAVNKLEAQLKDKSVKINIEENLPLLSLDFVFMEQAIRNIIDNACKHTPKNAEISISARRLKNSVEIKIDDNGTGLPKENPDKVFEKFFRAKPAVTGGTGLGLTISRSIIELHGGTVTASNKETGQGARFTITLPLNG